MKKIIIGILEHFIHIGSTIPVSSHLQHSLALIRKLPSKWPKAQTSACKLKSFAARLSQFLLHLFGISEFLLYCFVCCLNGDKIVSKDRHTESSEAQASYLGGTKFRGCIALVSRSRAQQIIKQLVVLALFCCSCMCSSPSSDSPSLFLLEGWISLLYVGCVCVYVSFR